MACPRIRNVVVAVWCVALANGLAWSLLTPTFQVPDETSHVAYVQQLAENGTRPGDPARPEFSSEQAEVLNAIGTLAIIGRPTIGAPINASASRLANREIARSERSASRADGGGPSTAAAQPPLYYALSAVVYRAFSWTSLPARIQAIRLLSVLFFAFAAAVVALIILEFVPRRPGAGLVAGLAVALSPYCAFIATGVTPDSPLLLVSSVVLYLLARAFTRGTTAKAFAVLGLAVGIGVLTKLTFLGFVPGVLVGVGLLLARGLKRDELTWAEAFRRAAYFAAAGAILPLCVLGWLLATGQPLRPASTAATTLPVGSIPSGNFREFLTYTWQLYLPRLPFMTNQFGFSALDETWLRGFAGRYGWLDYGVSRTLGDVALACFYSIGALAVVTAVWRRAVLATRWREIVVAVFCTAGLCLLISVAGYDYKRTTGLIFEQPRYLFPIVALYAAVVAAATYGLGRRGRPWVTTAVVALLLVHNLSGVALTIQRYYG